MKRLLRMPGIRPRATDDWYFTLLVLLNVASQGLQGLLAPLTKELAADLRVDLHSVGDLQSLFLVVYALFTPVWAIAALRYPRHRILVLVSLLWGTCCLGVTGTQHPVWFACGFALAAIGNAAVAPLTLSMAVDLVVPEDRGFAFGWLSTGQTLSLGLAYLVGGALVESHGWHAPFLVFGGLGAASAVALLAWKRYEPRHGAMEMELQELFACGQGYDYRMDFRDIAQLARPLSNLWILLASLLNMIPTGAVGFWFIAMLRHEHGFEASAATALMLTLYFVQVPGAVLIGRIADHWALRRIDGRLRLLMHLTWLTLPCYFAGFLIPWDHASLQSLAFWGFLGCVFAGALFASALQPLCFNAVGDVNPPEKRSLMFAVINITRLVGRAIGIQLVAITAAGWHGGRIGPALATVSVLLVPAALCVIPVIRGAARDRAALSRHLRSYVVRRELRDAA